MARFAIYLQFRDLFLWEYDIKRESGLFAGLSCILYKCDFL